MNSSKQKRLYGLYAITDARLMPQQHFAEKAEAALSAGTSIIQYRDKSQDRQKRLEQAETLKQLCLKYDALLIINDDLELAQSCDADGLHLGKDDLSLQQAREQLGKDKIIGVSCYNQLPLALRATQQGADYIAFGRFFSSEIKPDAVQAKPELIHQFKQQNDTPICCIGGITSDNGPPLIASGADMLAVISDIFKQSTTKDIQQKVRSFNSIFDT